MDDMADLEEMIAQEQSQTLSRRNSPQLHGPDPAPASTPIAGVKDLAGANEMTGAAGRRYLLRPRRGK